MPKKLFFELLNDKRTNIYETGILEFATYGYSNSSTNRIVKNAGISKGSLFKYFESKEDFYFFIIDSVINEFTMSSKDKISNLPVDLFDRLIKYSELEFDWYIHNPVKYKLMINTFFNNETKIYEKIEERYNLKGQDIYNKLLNDIDSNMLRWEKQKTIDILKWVLKGFNEGFIKKVQVQNRTDIEKIKSEYIVCLTEHIEILKTGLYKNYL